MIWAFKHFYYNDLSNAAIHMQKVKFSPITFKLAQEIEEFKISLDPITNAEWNEVITHVGQYKLDKGR